MGRYAELIEIDTEGCSRKAEAITINLQDGNTEIAHFNQGNISILAVDLGLLHWRHGVNPRPAFHKAEEAFEKAASMTRDYGLRSGLDWRQTVVAAALYLIDHPAEVHFWDEKFKKARWPCYDTALIYALHDKPLSDLHRSQLEAFLARRDDLIDVTYRTYFDLLRDPADGAREVLVRKAEENWLKRKTNRFFEDSDSRDGHGDYNELYVDIYLAAVLKKIGWRGDSIHGWRW